MGHSLPCHPNTFLVNLREFRVHGMFDEDFAGHYGYEDLYMNHVWEQSGGRRVILNDANYFDDLGFPTAGLDRDLVHNRKLAEAKLKAGTTRSHSILRFEWKQVVP